jgi:hypothetical protein
MVVVANRDKRMLLEQPVEWMLLVHASSILASSLPDQKQG